MLAAVEALVAKGYRHLDTFTPYPVREAERALGLRRSPIPLIVLGFGIAGAAGAYLLQYWLNAVR